MSLGYFIATIGFGVLWTAFISSPLWLPRVNQWLDDRIAARVDTSPSTDRLSDWNNHVRIVRQDREAS